MITRRDFLKFISPSALAALTPLQQSPDSILYIEATNGDCTQILQDAFDLLNDRYAYVGQPNAVLVLKGIFRLYSGPVYLRNKYRVRVIGQDCEIRYDTLDAQGSTYLTLERVHLNNPNNLAFLYGRNELGQGGGLKLVDCQIQGNVEIAQADTSTFDNVVIKGDTLLTTHHDGLCSVSTHKGNDWRNCWLRNVSMQGLIQNVSFHDCYFTGQVTMEDHPNAGTSNQVHNTNFDNCIVENVEEFIRITNQHGTHGLRINNLNISYHANKMIVVDNNYNNYGWDIGYIGAGGPITKIDVISGNVIEPRIL